MGDKDESKEIHLTGHYLQAKIVPYEGARWVDNSDFESSYEDQISVLGRRIDPNELKAIINKTAPDLIYDARILEVYEIAPDELLLKVCRPIADLQFNVLFSCCRIIGLMLN